MTPIVCAAVCGAITGSPATVTSNVVAAAVLLPKPSVAVTVMLSVPAVPSVSVSVARSAFTSVSVPLMVRVVPGLDTVFPAPPVSVADSTPCVSASVTVKISPTVLPLSFKLTPGISVG